MPYRRLDPDAPLHGYPVTYGPGTRVSGIFDGRRYVGTVVESGHGSTFDVAWDGGRGRGRFVHGYEPEGFRLATAADFADAVGDAQRLATSWVLRELIAAHPDWPHYVLDALRLKAVTLAGQTTRRADHT